MFPRSPDSGLSDSSAGLPISLNKVSVSYKSDQSVGKLRKVIKNENENDYNGIGARHLMLYRHNVDTYDPKMFECKEADKLLPLKEMWACFGDLNPPLKGAINIVVVPPRSKSIYP